VAQRDADPVVTSATEVIGGPRGRYAPPRELSWQLTAAVLSLLATVPVAFGVLLRVPCLRTHWKDDGQFWSACYSDLPNAFRDANLGRGVSSFLQGGAGAPTTGQPPLTGFLLTLVGSLVPSADRAGTRVAWYFALWAVLLTLLLLALIWLVASSARNPWAAAHIALAPVVALVAFVSADLVGVALAAAGMWAWSRHRPGTAGALLGLAIAARSYPVLILAAIAFLAVRSGQLGALRRTAAYAVVAFGGTLGGLWLLNPAAAGSSYEGWANTGAGYGSPWLLPQLAGHPLPNGAVSALAVFGWIVALLVGAVLALSSARRPTIAEVSLVMVGIVLVTGKSFTVQSSLWLVPLVAWCAVKWRDHLIWALAEALNFVAVWLNIAAIRTPDRGMPNSWYAFFAMLRVVAVLWIVANVWLKARDRWGTRAEPDDLAGPMHDADDRVLVRFT
jgi:hypothetical protein